MRFVAAVLAITSSACSFVGVKGASRSMTVSTLGTTKAEDIKCTESGILPALDALGGAAAIATSFGGTLAEHITEDGEPENFTIYYAGPALLLGIIYFYSASVGTDRTTRCTELKDAAREVKPIVIPVQPKTQEIDMEAPPQ